MSVLLGCSSFLELLHAGPALKDGSAGRSNFWALAWREGPGCGALSHRLVSCAETSTLQLAAVALAVMLLMGAVWWLGRALAV